MTTNRDFKQIVRARMLKTGESYTSARAQLLRPRAATSHAPPPTPPAPSRPDYATLAGTSDAALKARTGCDWEKWVFVLDKAGAHTWPHRDIAAWVREKYHIPGWWSQAVTVGYERIKGLRAKGQRRDGGYEVNKSRTFPVPVSRLFAAWDSAAARRRWLGQEQLSVKRGTRNRSMRLAWSDGTSVVLWFESPARSRSKVSVQHGGLSDKAAADRLRAFWAGALDRLKDYLVQT